MLKDQLGIKVLQEKKDQLESKEIKDLMENRESKAQQESKVS